MSPEELLKKSWYHFLAPRFWGLWIGLALLRLFICLPYPAILKLGHGMGHLARVLAKKRTRITDINLKLCFPDLSEEERKDLLKKNFASLGLGILEAGLAWWASDKRLRKMVEFKELENLELAKQANKGVLLISAHFTSIEFGLRLLSFATPIDILYLPPKNPLFAWIVQKARLNYIQRCIVQSDMRGLLKSLKTNHLVCYTPDQDKGRDHSVFAPFFGITAATVKATAKILKQTQSVALPALCVRNEINKKYILSFPPPENFAEENEVENATKVNKILENMIRQAPEQYLWQHKRFKTRPEGEASLY